MGQKIILFVSALSMSIWDVFWQFSACKYLNKFATKPYLVIFCLQTGFLYSTVCDLRHENCSITSSGNLKGTNCCELRSETTMQPWKLKRKMFSFTYVLRRACRLTISLLMTNWFLCLSGVQSSTPLSRSQAQKRGGLASGRASGRKRSAPTPPGMKNQVMGWMCLARRSLKKS